MDKFPLDTIVITIVLYKYSDSLEGKLPQIQSKVIEQRTGNPTLFDIPVFTNPSPQTKVLIKNSRPNDDTISHKADTDKTLSTIFPSTKDETKLQKARRILGDEVSAVSDDELGVYLAEFQFLLDSWLDEYERKVFNNKTLKELIKEDQNGAFSSR